MPLPAFAALNPGYARYRRVARMERSAIRERSSGSSADPDFATAPSGLRSLQLCNSFQSRMRIPAGVGIYKKLGNLRFLAAIDL